MRLHIIVATSGRAAVLRHTVARIAEQTRPPDGVIVVAVSPSDVAGLSRLSMPLEIAFSPRGLCSQRNVGLDFLHGRGDLIIFFDDDFVPAPTYLAAAERLFQAHWDIIGASGRVIADGVRGPGIPFEEAVRVLEEDANKPQPPEKLQWAGGLYGCNMVIRAGAAEGLRFDENLPLYGWQEDIDFTYRLGKRGRLVKSSRMAGVHMGAKTGRSPGRSLGYSQIANPVYLLRKGVMPRTMALKLMTRSAGANLFRSCRPERHVDRRGRLMGNALAISDLLTGRIDPRRIVDLS